MFVLRTQGRDHGWIEGNRRDTQKPPSECDGAKDILLALHNHECTAAEAAIRFDMAGIPIPESVRMLLAKENVEQPDPTEGQYAVVSPEAMALRAKEGFAQIARQKAEFLPDRCKEVEEAKVSNSGRDTFQSVDEASA